MRNDSVVPTQSGKKLLLIMLVGLVLIGCATSTMQEEDYTRIVSVVVTGNELEGYEDCFSVHANIRKKYVQDSDWPPPSGCSVGVLANEWACAKYIRPQPIIYETKVLLDGEFIPISHTGTGLVLTVKVLPLDTQDKVKLKGLFMTSYGGKRRIYPIDAVCVLGEETVIFEERFRSLPSNKIAPKTEEPAKEKGLGMITLREAIEIGKEELKRIDYSYWNKDLIVKADDNNTAWNNHISSWTSDKRNGMIEIGRFSPSGSESVMIDPKEKEYWAIYYVPKNWSGLGGDGFVFIDRSNGKVIGVILGK